METLFYTHALWRVKPGQEAAFVEGWSALAEIFSSLDRPPIWGTLIRSTAEPNVFCSFGPWKAEQDVQMMRSDPAAQKALAALMALCEEATPGTYQLVRHIEVQS